MSDDVPDPDPTSLTMREDALCWWTRRAERAAAHSGRAYTPLSLDEWRDRFGTTDTDPATLRLTWLQAETDRAIAWLSEMSDDERGFPLALVHLPDEETDDRPLDSPPLPDDE
ncbi:hypothetical protein [Acidipropionibacterium acidipropionici]|uniref:hypothetical protein n=1 Tax=Acidipropionibacterium acidipropionici TaxID=1748 RepID=UPI00041CFB77|nr:hypothetical protein [Acidipropionibacterium acidipropionici]ALN14345.1 hypothetical protein ASQ49_02640 [Acidipropionibacterium acidipropionici]APZ09892.1 hypothetical protein BWX38_12310 [Acidipropionibacterium acidipropionici]